MLCPPPLLVVASAPSLLRFIVLLVVVVVKKEPEGVVANDEGSHAPLLLGAPARLRKLLGGFLRLLLCLAENLMRPSLTQTLPLEAPK